MGVTKGCFAAVLWLVVVFITSAQDLFLAPKIPHAPGQLPGHTRKRADGFASLSSGPSSDSTGDVFTIHPTMDLLMCLDVVTDQDIQYLQLWSCNAHENQLFYFDKGSNKIRWAGDGSKCVDAGDMNAGTTLILWDCNDQDQQTWGYDLPSGTIFLSNSQSDASLCMDLTGQSTDLGNNIQIWGCDGWENQKWTIERGITIRSYNLGVNFCLDLQGGNTDKGTPVQMWACNGLWSQRWIWDDWQIKLAKDPSKCLDAGEIGGGGQLFIWDCNGYDQQIWGFDGDNNQIYLAKSTSDASMCMDIHGGELWHSGMVTAWNCNGCWNQHWWVNGPWDNFQDSHSWRAPNTKFVQGELKVNMKNATANLTPQVSNATNVPNDCPSYPGTPVFGHCMSDPQTYADWPVFGSSDELWASPWAKYFQWVYGEVPSTGYPICTKSLMMIYKDLLSKAGVQTPVSLSYQCPTWDGEFYSEMGFPNDKFNWIYTPALSQPFADDSGGTTALPSFYWVEVMHSKWKQDGEATWFYYTPGSAVWMYLGNSKSYDNHPDATWDLLGEACKYQAGDKPNECELQFGALYSAAIEAGWDSLQFLYHSDMSCAGSGTANLAIEIIDVHGPGRETCSGKGGKTRFRAGWEAQHECTCDSAQETINCVGFGMWR